MKVHEMKIYSNAFDILEKMYNLQFPQDEKYMLRSQMIRAGQSIILNIAECKNFTGKKQIQFLKIALGSANECLACCEIYERFINSNHNDIKNLKEKLDYESRMLYKLVTNSELRIANREYED